ncbi:MAG: ribosome maturation factor RimM [Hydrogenothermaceae bacterium]|nr:ribosome maturation factor RimM [Hydrogenothermaceae bacterium]
MEEFVAVGKVYSTFGVDGNLKVELFLDIYLPEDVFLKIKDSFLSLKVQAMNRKKGTIKFKNYDSLEKAKELSNSLIYIPKTFLPATDENEYFVFELIDSEVFQEKRKIGKIVKVDDRLPQASLVIACEDGKERYLPFIKQFVGEVDREGRKVYINPPEGWFEL